MPAAHCNFRKPPQCPLQSILPSRQLAGCLRLLVAYRGKEAGMLVSVAPRSRGRSGLLCQSTLPSFYTSIDCAPLLRVCLQASALRSLALLAGGGDLLLAGAAGRALAAGVQQQGRRGLTSTMPPETRPGPPGFVFDIDGVLVRGAQVLPTARK